MPKLTATKISESGKYLARITKRSAEEKRRENDNSSTLEDFCWWQSLMSTSGSRLFVRTYESSSDMPSFRLVSNRTKWFTFGTGPRPYTISWFWYYHKVSFNNLRPVRSFRKDGDSAYAIIRVLSCDTLFSLRDLATKNVTKSKRAHCFFGMVWKKLFWSIICRGIKWLEMRLLSVTK